MQNASACFRFFWMGVGIGQAGLVSLLYSIFLSRFQTTTYQYKMFFAFLHILPAYEEHQMKSCSYLQL